MSLHETVKGWGKKLKDEINRPAFTMSPAYKAKRSSHENARGKKKVHGAKSKAINKLIQHKEF